MKTSECIECKMPLPKDKLIYTNENTTCLGCLGKKAAQMQEAQRLISSIETFIFEAFSIYEYTVATSLEFEISSDYYDNSITIDMLNKIPYPYEPKLETRAYIKHLGFEKIFWTFPDGDEIRDDEPRRKKTWGMPYVYIKGVGYVDDRFSLKQWRKTYGKDKK